MQKTLKTLILCSIAALCALCAASCAKQPETNSVTAERLIAANDRLKVVSEYGNMQVTMTAENDTFGTHSKITTVTSNEYGLIWDYEDEESDDSYLYVTYINGMRYTAIKNGDQESYYADVLAGDYTAFLNISDINPQADVGTPEIKDGKIVLVVTETCGDTATSVTYEDTFYCNSETLLIEKIISRSVSDGEEVATDEYTYVYGADYAPRLKAYSLHKNATDKANFIVVRNGGTDSENRTEYTVAGTSELKVENSGDAGYALFADEDCTVEVKDYKEYTLNGYVPVFYLVEKAVPTVQDLLKANDTLTVVNKYGDVHVSGGCIAGGDGADEYRSEWHVSKNDYGLVFDVEENNPTGELVRSVTVMDGVRYRYFAHDDFYETEEEFGFTVIAADDYNEFVKDNLMHYIFNENVTGKPALSDGKIVLNTSVYGYGYRYVFNAFTMLLESCTITTSAFSVEFEFTYGVNYASPRTAYEMHRTAEDSEEIAVIRNAKTDKEQRIFCTVSASSDISVLDDGDKEYALFENASCTRGINDINKFIADNEYPIIYLGKAKTEAISFVYACSQADYDEFVSLLTDFETAALNGQEDLWSVEIFYEYMWDKYLYIGAQADIAKAVYDLDNTDPKWDDYLSAYNAYLNSANAVNATFKRLYEANAAFNDVLFRDWTEQDIDGLINTDDETDKKIAELDLANQEIIRTIDGLDRNSSTFTAQASELYETFVANNQKIATFKGYADYYEYANKEVYLRDRCDEEIVKFGAYVKKYITPIYGQITRRLYELETKLSGDQLEQADIIVSKYSRSGTDYLSLYFASFGGTLGEHFNALFGKNVALFAEDDNGSQSAYTIYSDYYGEPYCVFGSGEYYQSLRTVVHEAGHYVSFYNYTGGGSYDLLETHSQGNEFLFLAFMKDYLDEDVYEYCVLSRVENALWTIILNSVINEFETGVYGAETPYTAECYEEKIAGLCKDYGIGAYQDFVTRYTLYVATNNPVYYISYAVSLVSVLDLYVKAAEDYKAAQECYRILQEDAAQTEGFKAALALAGIGSPFDENTFIKINAYFDFDTAEYNAAVEDAVFAEESEIRELVTLTIDDSRVSWNEDGKVLLLTFHKYPDSYVEGSTYTTGDWYMWTFTDGEIIEWYEKYGDNVADWSVAIKQLLGMPLSSTNCYISAVWVSVDDVIRPAYQPDPATQLTAEDLKGSSLGEYKEWFDSNIIGSYFSQWGQYPWTRLGYTYRWGGDDEYGLTEFLVLKYSTIEVEFTKTLDDFVLWLGEQAAADEIAQAA